MFNSKCIFFITKSSITMLSKKTSAQKIDIANTFVKNQEVIDPQNYQKYLVQFLTKTQINNFNAIIFISDELLYEKKLEPAANPSLELIKYKDELPFNTQNIDVLFVESKTGNLLLAVNNALYLPLVKSAEEVQGKITAVLPAKYFQLAESSLAAQSADKIYHEVESSPNSKKLNFILSKSLTVPSIPADAKNQPSPQVLKDDEQNNTFRYMIFTTFAILLVGAVVLLVSKKDILLQKVRKPTQEQITAQNNPQPTTVTTQSKDNDITLQKEDITITVENGTGVEGQAAKVKSTLENLGYTNVETANTKVTNANVTTVIFAQNVSIDLKAEIEVELTKLFEEVNSEVSQESDSSIHITTGQEKIAI